MSKMKFIMKEPINKGWSDDKKYCVTDDKGTRYLLRVSDILKQEAKRSEFDMMKRIAALGVPMCVPIEFGICEEGVYSVQSWIDGVDAEEAMPSLADTEQYEYGQAFIDYINENRRLLKNRPQVYQHGDYHIGNMMIDHVGQLHIIDFNRNDYGDPWEEFNRIVWCAQKSPLFASGMVNGYFDGEVPLKFWKLLALYISSNTLSSVYWAIPFGRDEVDTMLNQAREVLVWYDNMKNPVPSWYLSGLSALKKG